MLEGKRIVVCIPYGRRRTVSILMNYLRRDRGIIDEVQFWMNTDPEQVEDVAWAREQERIYKDWVHCMVQPFGQVLRPKQLNTGVFYAYATAPDTLYFRFDDDIVYVHPGYFREMVAYRLAHPDWFLVFGNIWNNAILSYIHQQAGRIGTEAGVVQSPYCMDPVGWASPDFGIYVHHVLLDAIEAGRVDEMLFDEYPLEGKRFSISNFVWRGEDALAWGGPTVERDEEIFLTEVWPTQQRLRNVICGRGLVAHYTFFTQRAAIEGTDILERYKRISEDALSHAYYDLLGQAG